MSNNLLRIGRWAFRRRRWVLSSWIILLVGLSFLMVQIQKPTENSFSIPGTESQTALNKLQDTLPASAGFSGNLVFASKTDDGVAKFETDIENVLAKVRQINEVEAATNPFQTGSVSPDGRIAVAQVRLKSDVNEIKSEFTTALKDAIQPTRTDKLQTEIGGDIVSEGGEDPMGSSELIGLGIAGLVLMMTFGSFIAAGMPLMVAILGVGISTALIYSSSAFIDLNSTTPILATMLGIAVGIDYALFIVTRHRKYVMDGHKLQTAAARATATAGNAVVFAALTVIIALAALSVIGIPFVTSMGIAAAGAVAIAAIIAITLIPAVLGFAGMKILSRKQRGRLAAKESHLEDSHIGTSWAKFVVKRPLLILTILVPLMAVAALPISSLEMGFPGQGDAPKDTTQRKAYDLVAEGFGTGLSGPLLIVVEPNASADTQQTVDTVNAKLQQTDNVVAAQTLAISPDESTAVLQVIPGTGPRDQATKDLIKSIRDNKQAISEGQANISVTGSTAMMLDVDKRLIDSLPKYIIVVVGLSLLLLVILFRSIVVPIKATLGFLLTLGVAFGALTAFFQWNWFGWFDYSLVFSFMPILLTGILFGLAMDYEFFMVSGIHEAYEHEKKGAKPAIISGFSHGSKVVTAAAIIMISVFAGFISSHDTIIQMMGFTLAVGIFTDAFLVRMTLVPAVLALFGDKAWWIPRRLGKILPKVTIEAD